MSNKINEKALLTQLLESKIEKLTGKKVIYEEKASVPSRKERLMKELKEAVEAGEMEKEALQEIFGFFKNKYILGSGFEASKAGKNAAALNFTKTHPAAKTIASVFKKKYNLDDATAWQAARAVYDTAQGTNEGGTALYDKYNYNYDPTTHLLTIDTSGKGLFSGGNVLAGG